MQREATAMNVRQNLGELLNGVQYRRDQVVITKAGKPIAAMVDMATFERMRRRDTTEFDRAWTDISAGFDDLTEEQAQALANEVLGEAREEIAKKKLLQTSALAVPAARA